MEYSINNSVLIPIDFGVSVQYIQYVQEGEIYFESTQQQQIHMIVYSLLVNHTCYPSTNTYERKITSLMS